MNESAIELLDKWDEAFKNFYAAYVQMNEIIDSKYVQVDIPSGIECPECGGELIANEPKISGSLPLGGAWTRCPNCSYQGRVYDWSSRRNELIRQGKI